jgi:hypothetical protein
MIGRFVAYVSLDLALGVLQSWDIFWILSYLLEYIVIKPHQLKQQTLSDTLMHYFQTLRCSVSFGTRLGNTRAQRSSE